MKDILKQIMKDKYASIALIVLLVMYLMILFANFIAPYSKDFADRNQSYAPPSKVFIIDENGKFSKPYTYNYKREYIPELYQTVYKLDRSHKYYIQFLKLGLQKEKKIIP